MKVVDPGRIYELAEGNSLVFLQRQDGSTTHKGTTNEEVLEVLIDRVTEAYQTLPCQESIRALHFLREAIAAFRLRTERRIRARVEGTYQPHQRFPEFADDFLVSGMSPTLDAIDGAPN